MQAFLKKNFWIVNVVTVMVCATFAAKAAVHWVDGSYLADDSEPTAPRVRPKPKKKKMVMHRSKDGTPLAKRNMFCSACVPPEPVAAEGPVEDSDTPPPTSLPLRLIATNVTRPDSWSFATISNTSSSKVGAYKVGELIPEAGAVVRIRGKYVDFTNEQAKRVERLAFDTKNRPRAKRPIRPPPRRPRRKRDEIARALDEGIHKIDDHHYEIDRSLVEKVLANPTAIRGARIVPSIRNGKPNGFKLYAIRPSSAFAKIGLQNGDTIRTINGFDMTSPDKALEVYTKVREANNLSITITRRGKPVTMEYNIR